SSPSLLAVSTALIPDPKYFPGSISIVSTPECADCIAAPVPAAPPPITKTFVLIVCADTAKQKKNAKKVYSILICILIIKPEIKSFASNNSGINKKSPSLNDDGLLYI